MTNSLVDVRGRLASITVGDAKLQADIVEAVSRATLDFGTDAVTELTIEVEDPGLQLMRALPRLNTPVRFGDLRLVVAATNTGGGRSGVGGFTLESRSAGAEALKQRTGPLVMPNVSPSRFVQAECAAVGLSAVVEDSPTRPNVSRDVKKDDESERPSSWSTFARLAHELGFLRFEFAGTVYFGRPSWLMKQAEPLRVLWQRGDESMWPLTTPECSRSLDRPEETTVRVELPPHRLDEVRLGRVLSLSGVPTFNGHYLITSARAELSAPSPVNITGETPVDPEPLESR